jgi:cytochrome c553
VTAKKHPAAVAVVTAAAVFNFGGSPPALAQPAPPKAQSCAACHGADGNSPTPAVPSLAGQPRQFIVTQLIMFREGNRKDPQMSPFATGLTNQEVNELGAFFSAQKLAPPGRKSTPEQAAAGKRLAEQLNCNQCHGPSLLGQQHIPRLAGQHADYLRAQLRGFKAATRFDMDGQMTSAAQALSAGDIESLADYLANLAVP